MVFGYVLPSHFDRRVRADDAMLSLVPIEPVATPEFLGVRLQFSF
jgi:hypothetical protein